MDTPAVLPYVITVTLDADGVFWVKDLADNSRYVGQAQSESFSFQLEGGHVLELMTVDPQVYALFMAWQERFVAEYHWAAGEGSRLNWNHYHCEGLLLSGLLFKQAHSIGLGVRYVFSFDDPFLENQPPIELNWHVVCRAKEMYLLSRIHSKPSSYDKELFDMIGAL